MILLNEIKKLLGSGMSKQVILLGHKARVGKDTSAGFLESFGYIRYAFADKLKATVSDLYDFTEEQMYGEDKDLEDTRFLNNIDNPLIFDEIYVGQDGSVQRSRARRNPDYRSFLTPRRILQRFGQDQRLIYPDIWAQYVFNEIEKSDHNVFVITDFRFKNEYTVARRWADLSFNNQLFTVKINRPGVSLHTGSNDISENDLNDFDEWDYIIENDSTLEDLAIEVIKMKDSLK